MTRRPALSSSHAADRSGVRQPGNRRSRVLIIEDNVDAAESLMMLLELLGHEVQVAHDGRAGLEAAHTAVPDIILVDIGLPGMDGYEVARRARQDPLLERTHLVAVTGYGSEDDKRAARAAGFDEHMVKPLDPDALQALISRHAG